MDRTNFEFQLMSLLKLPQATASFELTYSAGGQAQVKAFHYKKDDKGNWTNRLQKTVYDVFEENQ